MLFVCLVPSPATASLKSRSPDTLPDRYVSIRRFSCLFDRKSTLFREKCNFCENYGVVPV